MQKMYFYNNTDLPIMVNSFVHGSSKLCSTRVSPYSKLLVESVSDWYLDSMFPDLKDMDAWRKKGLEKCVLVGKFRSTPCAQGEYAWMERDDPFRCIYSKGDKDDYGTMTLHNVEDTCVIMHKYF